MSNARNIELPLSFFINTNNELAIPLVALPNIENQLNNHDISDEEIDT